MNGSTQATARPLEPRTVEPAPISPEEWVERHGDSLYREALARVGQREAAEDLVQEVLVAAWQAREGFRGRASEKTWLMRILRNKIADHYRRQRLKVDLADSEALAELEESQFRGGGFGGVHWHKANAPGRWANPRQSLEQAEFWRTIHECTAKLPEKVARVFLLREVGQWESEDICRELDVKQSHLFVLLHRARLALRRCLELNWFRGDRAASPRRS